MVNVAQVFEAAKVCKQTTDSHEKQLTEIEDDAQRIVALCVLSVKLKVKKDSGLGELISERFQAR